MLGGLVFGCANLMLTWLNPVEDDSVTAVLRFYGPMFLMWVVIAFNAARASGRWRSAVADFNGRFTWVMDPEGNKIELWEPKPGF